eukprot:7152931-Karenia_brevis.AAC.1
MSHPSQIGRVRQWCWIKYRGEELFHQRLVSGVVERLATTQSDSLLLATTSPDGDTMVEDCGDFSMDVDIVRFSEVFRPPPRNIARDQVYRFRAELSKAQIEAYRVVALAAADERHNELRGVAGLPAVLTGEGFKSVEALRGLADGIEPAESKL